MRTIDSALLAALSSPTVRAIYLVELDFDSGVIAWNSGFRDITYNSVTFKGLGSMSSISSPNEKVGVDSSTITVGVSGIDPAIIALFMTEPYLNRTAKLYYTLLDDNDQVITGNPILLFRGSIDSIDGTFGSQGSFNVTIKSRLADWERKRVIRYTDNDQQSMYPGDKGFEYVGQMAQATIVWPRAAFLPDTRKN